MHPWLRTTLKLGVTLAVLYYLFVSLGETINELPRALVGVGWSAFTAALLLNLVATIVLPGIATKITVARQGLDLGWIELIRINFITRFYALVLPRGAALAVRWDRYRRAGSGSDATALVLFERVMMVFIYLFFAILCLGLEYNELPGRAGPILGALFVMLTACGLLLLPYASDSVANRFARLLDRFRPRMWPSAARVLDQQLRALAAYKNLTGRDLLLILAFTALGYGCFVSSAYALSAGMDFGLSFLALGWIRSLVFVITQIPVSVAGIGVRELGFVELLALYGTPRTEALAFALLLFLTQLLIGGIGGLLELTHHFFRRKEHVGISAQTGEKA